MKQDNQNNRIITLRRNNYFIADKVRGKTVINSPEIMILIHGYNVSEEEAKETYRKFEKNFNLYCNKVSTLNKVIYWFLWPSDKPNKLSSMISYYQTLKSAKICGKKFADYLNQLQLKSFNNQPPRIILIGHSLGCRLLLEALKTTKKDNKIWDIILMAAAVPVDLVKQGELLNLQKNTRENYHILYSKNDLVLRIAFPAGQRLAGEASWEAVGFKGNPNPGTWSKRKEMNYDHSDYWPGEEAAQWITLQLGIVKTTSRKVKTDRLSPAVRSRDVNSRTIGNRQAKSSFRLL